MGTPVGPNTINAKVPPSLLLKLDYDEDVDALSLVGYAELNRAPGTTLNAAGVVIQHDPFTGNVGVAYEDPIDGSYRVNLAFAHLDTLSFVWADDVYAVDRITTAGAALRDCRDSLFSSGLTGFSYLEPGAYVTSHEVDLKNQKVKVHFRLYSRFERNLSIRVRFAVRPKLNEEPQGWLTATGTPTSQLLANASAPEYVFEHDITKDMVLEGPVSLQYEIWPYEVPVFRQPCIDLLVDLYVQGRITGCDIEDDGIKVNGVGYATVPIAPGLCADCTRLGGATPGITLVGTMPLSEALASILELCHNQASEIPDYFWGILNANEDDSSANAWPTNKEGGVFNAGFVHDFDLFFEDAIRFDPATMGGGALIDDGYDWESNDAGVGVQLNTDPKPSGKTRSIIFEILTAGGGIRVGAGVAAGGAIVNTMRVWQGIHLLTVDDPVNGDVVGVYEKSVADLVTPATLVPGSDLAFPTGFKRGDLVYFSINLQNNTYQLANLMTGEAFAGALPAIAILWEWTASDIVAGFGTNARVRLMQALPDGGITAMLDGGLHARPLTISAWLQPFERDDEGVWPGGGHTPYPPNAVSDPLGVGLGLNVWTNNGGGSALAVAGVGSNLKYHGGAEWVAGREYFIAVVYDVDETRVYADGLLLATGPAFVGTNVGWYQLSIGRHQRYDWPWGFGPMRFVRITAGPRYGAELPILDEINLADAAMAPIPTLPMTGPVTGEQEVFGDQPDAWELYDDVGGTTSQLDAGEEVVLDRGPGIDRNPRTIEVVLGAAPTARPATITVAGSFTGNSWLPISPIPTPLVPTLLPELPYGILGSRNFFQGRVRDARIAQKAYEAPLIALLNANGPAVTPTQAGLPPECLPSTLLDGALMWIQPAGQPEVICEAWAEPGEVVTFGDCTPDGKTVLGSSGCAPYVPFEVLTFGGIAISTRRFKGYNGPCCTIRKVSDPGGPTFDVGWDSEGWRDDAAAEAWAGGEATECVRVYSQAPDAEDLVIDDNPNCDGPFRVTNDSGVAYKTPDTGKPMFWTGVADFSAESNPENDQLMLWMISEGNIADNADKMICSVAIPYRPKAPGTSAPYGWIAELCGMSDGVFAHELKLDASDGSTSRSVTVEFHDLPGPETIKVPQQWFVEETVSLGYAAPVFGGGAFNIYKNGNAMPLVVQANGGQWGPNRKMRVGGGQVTDAGSIWKGGVCEFVCVNGTYPNSRARDITRNQGLAFGAITS